MPAPETTFAAVFEQLRLAKGWSPAEVSRRLAVSPTQVSRWRRGSGVPSIQTIEIISTLFGVDRETLEALAGYRANTIDGAQPTVDPEISALLESDRQAIRDEFAGIPPVFWKPIIDARRVAGQLAVENVKAAIRIAQGLRISGLHGAPISSSEHDSSASQEQGEEPPSGGRLSTRYLRADHKEHSANGRRLVASLSGID